MSFRCVASNSIAFFIFIARRQPRSTLFPYTTLFRSVHDPSAVFLHRASEPRGRVAEPGAERSEEHTSELQSRLHLVCRLLLEKKESERNRGIPLVGICASSASTGPSDTYGRSREREM